MAVSKVASSGTSVQMSGAGAGTLACPVNPTTGNYIVVGAISFRGAGSVGSVTVTKASGTATIGTPVQDKTDSAVPGQGTKLRIELVRVPITGSGTLSLTVTSSNGDLVTFGWAEFVNLGAVDTTAANTGTSATYTTGNVVSSAAGIVIALYCDDTASTPTYTPSDTLTWEQPNAANVTGLMQAKILASAGTNALTVGSSNFAYDSIAVGYLDAGGGGGGPTLNDHNFRSMTRGLELGLGRGMAA